MGYQDNYPDGWTQWDHDQAFMHGERNVVECELCREPVMDGCEGSLLCVEHEAESQAEMIADELKTPKPDLDFLLCLAWRRMVCAGANDFADTSWRGRAA